MLCKIVLCAMMSLYVFCGSTGPEKYPEKYPLLASGIDIFRNFAGHCPDVDIKIGDSLFQNTRRWVEVQYGILVELRDTEKYPGGFSVREAYFSFSRGLICVISINAYQEFFEKPVPDGGKGLIIIGKKKIIETENAIGDIWYLPEEEALLIKDERFKFPSQKVINQYWVYDMLNHKLYDYGEY